MKLFQCPCHCKYRLGTQTKVLHGFKTWDAYYANEVSNITKKPATKSLTNFIVKAGVLKHEQLRAVLKLEGGFIYTIEQNI